MKETGDREQKNRDELIRKRILDWAAPCFPLEIRDRAAQVYVDYIRSKHSEDIDYFASEIEFGTGGMRGIIGNGAGRMNPWTIGRATLGFCNYLKRRDRKPSMAIAYDSRRMSAAFARTVAGIAAGEGIKVFLLDDVAPTPILSYAIRKLELSGGAVITASHNPPEYNGFKVYMEDGAQLVGPRQQELEESISAIVDWGDIHFTSPEEPLYRQNVKLIGADIKRTYIKEFKKCAFISAADNPAKKRLKIVYSPLHGTGGRWLPDLLQAYGFEVHQVKEQQEPDGEFPTVRYPNPEEPEAMRMAEETARELDADLFLASDPDADRLGAGVKSGEGQYTLLNGNQLGSIMCAFMCERISGGRARQGRSEKERRWHVLKTIVTTDLQREIARRNGIAIHDVLTGFKYIAEQMRYMEEGQKRNGYTRDRDVFLFGGEESYGYLPVSFVRDKDSLAAALLLCEIMAEHGSLLSYLNQVYLKYHLYLEDLKSVTLKGSEGQGKIQEIIETLRDADLIGWELGDRRVVSVLDYQKQTRDGKASSEDFKNLPASNVLQLILEPEGKLTIRPSGTEPKVKLYASLRHPNQPSSLDELEKGKKELTNELATISGAFFARAGLT